MSWLAEMQNYDYDTLVAVLSDYSKDVYGYRMNMNGQSREEIIEAIKGVDAYMERMSQTFEGREELRQNNWIIEETDPELKKLAQQLADEREFERQRQEAEMFDSQFDRVEPVEEQYDWTEQVYGV